MTDDMNQPPPADHTEEDWNADVLRNGKKFYYWFDNDYDLKTNKRKLYGPFSAHEAYNINARNSREETFEEWKKRKTREEKQ